MSLFTVGGMAGFALGPLLITPTLIALGTGGAVFLAAPVLLMSVTVAYNLPRLATVMAPHRTAAAGGTAVDAPERWGDFARLTTVVVFRSTVFYGLNTFIPLYWTAVLRGSKTGGGLALTALSTAVVVGTLIGGRSADRYGRRIVIVVSLASLALLLLMFVRSTSLTTAAILLGPMGIALAASSSVMVVMGQEYLPNRLGLAAGVTLGLSMTIGGLLMPLFGSIADRHGLSVPILLLSGVAAAGFAFALTLHETAEVA
jgi:MFS transporter, FSR family, fosmidomycin resistance protein